MSLASLLQHEVVVAFGLTLVLLALLHWLRPAERRAARAFFVVLALCAFARGLALAIDGGAPRAASIVSDIAMIVLGLLTIRIAGTLAFRVLLPFLGINTARILEDLLVTAAFLAWGFVWLRLAGVDLASLVTTSAVITAVIAFSMQDTLGNILGGVVLQLDNSVRVGDWVKIDDVSGQVVEVRWRYTAIETRNRETVMFPNSWLMKNRFSVIGSRADAEVRWRRWVWFNVDLDCSPGQVCSTLEGAVREARIDNVAADPPPSAVLMDLEQGMARYALRYWLIDPRLDDPTDSRVRTHALAALVRHGMQPGIPREERLITKDNESRRAALQAEEMAARRKALDGVDLFASLSEAERGSLAERLVYAPFVSGDTITRQGAVAHWLYIIVRGEADVWVEQGEERQFITTLSTGSVFGEMGMMTGEPRRASLTAKTDVECYRLDKEGFQHILTARPDVAAKLSEVLATRLAELEQQRAAARLERRPAPRHDDILARIRSFFGLDAG
jgi:small-conductance mechanosensitive channel/CRP-like cAMP-binding protein